MLNFALIKNSTFSAGILSLCCFAMAVSETPSKAASINFNTAPNVTKYGDVYVPPVGQVNMSTSGLNNDDPAQPTGTFNYSGIPAISVSSLDPSYQQALSLVLGIAVTQGSAIRWTPTVKAGDMLSFDWKFLTNEANSSKNDTAFLVINNNPIKLADVTNAQTPGTSDYLKETSLNTYNYTFINAGDYDIAFAIVDATDNNQTSALQVTNANLQGVPEPMTIISSVVALGCGASLRRRFGKKKETYL